MRGITTIIAAVILSAGTLFGWNLYTRHKTQLALQEQQRAAAERQRVQAEQQRAQAEQQRVQAERQRQAQEEARKAQLAEVQKEAQEEKAAVLAIQNGIGKRYGTKMQLIQGRRFTLNQTDALDWLQQVLNGIPKGEAADLISMYKAMSGFDGSTTADALAYCQRSFVGKYYVLQGDVFQIQADRDYPREGENEFMLFGQVNLPPFIPVNVAAISVEKIPPYRVAPMLTKIVGFNLGTNARGEKIVIPVVEVVVAVSGSSFSDDASDVIISEPTVVAKLLSLPSQRSDPDQQPSAEGQ